jgi:hypothetical protein
VLSPFFSPSPPPPPPPPPPPRWRRRISATGCVMKLLCVGLLLLAAGPAWGLEPINDTDSGELLRYSPGWTRWEGGQPRGGTLHYANQQGSFLELTFRGTAVYLLHEDGQFSCFHPIPLVPRRRPDRMQPHEPGGGDYGTFLLADVYQGLTGVPPARFTSRSISAPYRSRRTARRISKPRRAANCTSRRSTPGAASFRAWAR